MPNRYEREIEEILRNLEHTEPKSGREQKLGRRVRANSDSRSPVYQRRFFSRSFSLTEWLLIIAVMTALASGGYAYLQGAPSIITAILAVIGIVCLILVALSQFLFLPRRPQSMRYGNVTITPLRRSFFDKIKAKWNLFLLREDYRRKGER